MRDARVELSSTERQWFAENCGMFGDRAEWLSREEVDIAI